MLQQKYFKTLKFTLLCSWDIYLPPQKHLFQGRKWKGRPISFGSGTGRLVFFFQLVMVSIFIRQFPTKQTDGLENFYTPEKFTNRYQTWCCTWKMYLPLSKTLGVISNIYPWGENPKIHPFFRENTLCKRRQPRCPTNVTCKRRRHRSVCRAMASCWNCAMPFRSCKRCQWVIPQLQGVAHTSHHLWTQYEGL